jgi:hypothetical protein
LKDRKTRRSRATRTLIILAFACCLGVLHGVASARAPDPVANLQVGPPPPPCYIHPVSPACELPLVGELNAGRTALGLGPYVLPTDFVTLAPDRQLLILVNLDRRAYSLPLVSGVSPQLDAAAEANAVVDQDPAVPSVYRAVWASAWSGGLLNVLDAYYQWMYVDGFPGLNVGCPSPAATGCWIHRHGVLFAFQPSVKLTMGVATAVDRAGDPVVGMLIAATRHARGPGEDYTWAQAVADGAGASHGAGKAGPHRTGALAMPRITRAKVGSVARTAQFYFTAPRGAHFECQLNPRPSGGRAAGYSACTSPASYAGLRSGSFDFLVRTFTSATRHSAPAARRITIG